MSALLDTIPRLTKNFAGSPRDTPTPACRPARSRSRRRSGEAEPARSYPLPSCRSGRRARSAPRRMIGRVLLVVDVGNSNLTLCGVRDGALGAVRRATTERGADRRRARAAARRPAAARRAPARRGRGDRAGVGRAHVDRRTVGRVADGRLIPLRVAEAGHLPLPVRVDRPLEVGADRLVNASRPIGSTARRPWWPTSGPRSPSTRSRPTARSSAARSRRPGAASRRSRARTAKLPRVSLSEPGRAIGRDTVAAMRAGAVLGWRDLVSGLIGRVRGELAAHGGSPTRGGADDPDRRLRRAPSGRTASTSTSSIRCSRCAASRSSTPR